jgi:ubiquinone/menaquinone biosynthesis C-methylase UbiE
MKQVDKVHYGFSRYAHPDRFASYFYQLREIHDAEPKTVLEVGVGDKVIGNYLKDNTDIQYTSLDVADDVKPDVVGDILRMPFPDSSFDVVCAFEVLEHIPFESFDKALREMARIAKKRILISVPHFGPPVKFLLKLPFLPEIRFAFKIPFYKKHEWNGQHYWELGKKGYSTRMLASLVKKHGRLLRDYVPFENQYHHFFIIEK